VAHAFGRDSSCGAGGVRRDARDSNARYGLNAQRGARARPGSHAHGGHQLASGEQEGDHCQDDEPHERRVIRRKGNDNGASECNDRLQNQGEAKPGSVMSVVCHM
jgi:hypothetical protein